MLNLILGMVIGFVLGFLVKPSTEKSQSSVVLPNQEAVDNKQENLAKIMHALESKSEITNNDVQSLLNVSDATAERYLSELEKSGKLIQVPSSGRGVVYRKL